MRWRPEEQHDRADALTELLGGEADVIHAYTRAQSIAEGAPVAALADTTDRDAAKEVLFRLRLMHPEITIVWADSAYAGQLIDWARRNLNLTLKTVSRPKNTAGFAVLPRRWVVERSLAWIMDARRHARDYERLIQHSESLITWAAITLMTRRITRRTSRWSGQPASREAERD
nr:transposase [Streptomyces sp. RB17]